MLESTPPHFLIHPVVPLSLLGAPLAPLSLWCRALSVKSQSWRWAPVLPFWPLPLHRTLPARRQHVRVQKHHPLQVLSHQCQTPVVHEPDCSFHFTLRASLFTFSRAPQIPSSSNRVLQPSLFVPYGPCSTPPASVPGQGYSSNHGVRSYSPPPYPRFSSLVIALDGWTGSL